MDETPNDPQQVPPAASSEPAWGPPNPNYPPPGQYPSSGQYPPAGQYPPPGYVPQAGLSTNAAAALSYVTFIPAVIFLALEPYSRESFIRFHAWQCIVLTLVDIVGNVLFRHMGFFGFLVRSLLGLLLFIFWLIAIIKASQGERYHVPIVGDLAETLSAKM